MTFFAGCLGAPSGETDAKAVLIVVGWAILGPINVFSSVGPMFRLLP